ncbi:hypothetical protein PHYSODRAFT_246641 [Phytophthora sojae]|uniref:Uncharacterized protein n=1 Tax=Phytophthora sojae (strain P6497) TaxID=1094619 RepID=G5AD90_PHYSP|nr:hypothetical protein PHYSODRAFT_246641 [Phytophthora sojae]EGZ06143.1 hypothetical protein PHYSODRAFT_246641 [Phytophthora sojae]|eukprot:XP_009538040.1 hypothetical protein PHYSODRAFT_246641 [Phytophthora sojae]
MEHGSSATDLETQRILDDLETRSAGGHGSGQLRELWQLVSFWMAQPARLSAGEQQLLRAVAQVMTKTEQLELEDTRVPCRSRAGEQQLLRAVAQVMTKTEQLELEDTRVPCRSRVWGSPGAGEEVVVA